MIKWSNGLNQARLEDRGRLHAGSEAQPELGRWPQEKDNYIQFWNMPGIFVGNLKFSTNFENLEICRIF